MPSLLDHRGFPLLAGRKYLVLRAADLCLDDLELLPNEQEQLPAELMRPQHAPRLAAVLLHDEELAQFNRGTVPIGALKNIHCADSSTARYAGAPWAPRDVDRHVR